MAKSIRNPIFSALGGYFTANDSYRHAIVGTAEGKVFDISFGQPQAHGRSYLACFDAITAADAFFTPDDDFGHVIVATPNGDISEIFNGSSGTFFTSPPLANFSDILGISAFFTPDDGLRRVIVATGDGNLTEVSYGIQAGTAVTQLPLANFANIVDIAAFYTADDGLRHVIVATGDGNVTEVYYGPAIGVRIAEPPLGTDRDIVSIAAFYSPDDRARHVIAATSNGDIIDKIYGPTIGVHIGWRLIATLRDIVGIAAFYTPDDSARHVIAATGDGSVTEVYYYPQSPPYVSQPALDVFGVDAPTLEDISPDLSNLDANASAVLSANDISTAGRSVSIAGNADELFVFNQQAGVWKNTGELNWSALPRSPLTASIFPPSQIDVDPVAGGHVVAGTLQGAFESTDGGSTWTPIQQTWPCGSAAIRAVAFAKNSELVLATDCGIATRPAAGQPFTYFPTAAGVGALAVSQTKLWACSHGSLFVSTDNGATWTALLTNNTALNSLDSRSLAAFDNFVYFESSVSGLGGCGSGNIIGVYDVANNILTTQPVTASGRQTCDGTGLGGRRFVRSFILDNPALPATIGPAGRLQLFFGAGQEVYQALGSDPAGNITNWNLVVATIESAATTSIGANPPVRIHADIWDFLIDTSGGGTKAWVAGDGGVYENVLSNPFVFPESDGWIRRFGGMHTHQAHMITVIPTNPVNRSRLAYPTGDNEGWYRNTSMLDTPTPGWEVTFRDGNLGDASWTMADASSPHFSLITRNQAAAAFINHRATPDIRFISFLNFWMKKDAKGNPKVLQNGHFYPDGPTAFQFIQSPKGAGRFPSLDAVMMCDLPLIKYDAATDTNIPLLPNTPLAANTNGQPVLLRNKSFDSSPDINADGAAGWVIEIPSFPPGTEGFYVTGSRTGPVYYSFTSTTLSRRDGNNWTTIASNVSASPAFGPAFVNPYDSKTVYVITPNSIEVSVDGGSTFTPEQQLTALVAGRQGFATSTLAQISFSYDNPDEIVAGAQSGVFYRNASGHWVDLTSLLPAPLSLITGVGIDCEALYVSFDSRSVVRITGYRNA
ncbi:WD40/YVTN/BNR-like repeat-containing protein [Streptomyces sp. NPDC004721]